MLRAFEVKMLIAIDESEADERDYPVTLQEVKDFVGDAAEIVLDLEEHGNPCGVGSVEVNFDTMRELSPEEVKQVYGK